MSRLERPVATRELIAETALELIDEEGLRSLSVERVASRLGIRGPSLYYHFKDKSEVLTAVARRVLSATPVLPLPEATEWREWQVQQAVGYRRAILRHPNTAPLLLGYRPRELFADQYERVSSLLVEAGVPYRYHLVIYEATDKFTLGSAMFAASMSTSADFFPHLDADQMPLLARAVEANPWNPEQIFIEALRHFLAAIPDRRRRLR